MHSQGVNFCSIGNWAHFDQIEPSRSATERSEVRFRNKMCAYVDHDFILHIFIGNDVTPNNDATVDGVATGNTRAR